MDDWDPFADPADAPPAPARPAPPVAVPVAVDAVPVEEATGDIPDLPSLAELEQQLQKAQLESCPELVQAAFAGDEAKVQAGARGEGLHLPCQLGFPWFLLIHIQRGTTAKAGVTRRDTTLG